MNTPFNKMDAHLHPPASLIYNSETDQKKSITYALEGRVDIDFNKINERDHETKVFKNESKLTNPKKNYYLEVRITKTMKLGFKCLLRSIYYVANKVF